MTLPDIPAIVNTIKQSARAICVITGVILFLPQKYLAVIGIGSLVVTYRQWIGILFLISLVFALRDVFNVLGMLIDGKMTHSLSKKKLHNLTREEKILLSHYIYENTKTQKLNPFSGVVNGLVYENIIYRAAQMGVEGIDYNIQDWAWDYLQENKHLINP
jgi:superinfection exclusion protein B